MQIRFRRIVFTYLIVLIFSVCASVLRADVTGSLLGTVRDHSQAAIAGARVVVTNTQTNFSEETTSAPDGSYRFLALPPGTYKLTATGAGFRPYAAIGIEVKVNDQLRVDVTLEIGTVQEEVSVSANAVRVETETTQLGD